MIVAIGLLVVLELKMSLLTLFVFLQLLIYFLVPEKHLNLPSAAQPPFHHQACNLPLPGLPSSRRVNITTSG